MLYRVDQFYTGDFAQILIGVYRKTALFTIITELPGNAIIDLYSKWNRVEHCFRTISMHDLMAPEYHWTPPEDKDSHAIISHCIPVPCTDL